MELDGSGGHRPMVWKPSDMVSMVDRSLLMIFVREKVRYFVRTLTKKSIFAQLTFFNSSLSGVDVSFVINYPYVNCRARSALFKTVLTLF